MTKNPKNVKSKIFVRLIDGEKKMTKTPEPTLKRQIMAVYKIEN